MNKEVTRKFKLLVDKCNESYYCFMNGMTSKEDYKKSREKLNKFVDNLVKESGCDSYNEGVRLSGEGK